MQWLEKGGSTGRGTARLASTTRLCWGRTEHGLSGRLRQLSRERRSQFTCGSKFSMSQASDSDNPSAQIQEVSEPVVRGSHA